MSLSNEINICKKGNLEDILSLINQGCDSECILQYTSKYGHLEMVKYLVEECGVNARADNDFAVRWASENGHLEVVKYLVEKCGAPVNNDYAVRWASAGDHFEVVKYLIEHYGSILPQPNPNYLIVCEKGEKKRRCIMVKRIYVQGV